MISVKLLQRLFDSMADLMNVNITFVAFHPSFFDLILSKIVVAISPESIKSRQKR